jgi:hypothetical protein
VSALILGHYPSTPLLRAAGLAPQFEALLVALRKGNGAATMQELERWREWHRAHGNYSLLRERMMAGCWRNLLRRW